MAFYFLSIIILFSLLNSCTSKKLVNYISYYNYSINDDDFRLHSVTTEDPGKSFNRLIGRNFLAFDYDKDGVIDYIEIGDIEYDEVQRIYSFGIIQAKKENRLRSQQHGNGTFIYESHNFVYEIRSYRSGNIDSFNEIKIIDKRQTVQPRISIALDKAADGTIDHILQGNFALGDMQVKYSEIIKKGLQKGGLVKSDSKFLVKEK